MSESSPVERIKRDSRLLRGTLVESLADPLTGAIREDDTVLVKFHGSYQQDDRDIREERRRQKLEPAYSFMIRTRLPGGVCTPAQWLALDDIARRYANGTLRITTRQAFQFHGVIKTELKATMAAINASLIDTIAACGDVNRNVLASANPVESRAHAEVYGWARRLSEHLLPRTRAYHEIWLDGAKVAGTEEVEPIYGPTYLPRKFKAAIVVPPVNDVDVFAHDLGFIAIVEDGELKGFNLTVGGGLGATHGDPTTYPRIADVVGFLTPDQLLAVAEAVVTTQRDFGNRAVRKHARLKYTIDARGLDWFVTEVTRRQGFALEPARPFEFTSTGDRFGWVEGFDGRWHLTLRIEAGRVADTREGEEAHRPARDREGASRRLPPHAQPEPDRRQRRALRAPVHRRAGGSPRARRTRAQHAGAPRRACVRGAADLSAGDGGGGALPARVRPAGRAAAGGTRPAAICRWCCASPAVRTAARVRTSPKSRSWARRRAATTCTSVATDAASA